MLMNTEVGKRMFDHVPKRWSRYGASKRPRRAPSASQICPSSIGPSLGPTCTKTLASNPRMTDNSPEMVAKISKIKNFQISLIFPAIHLLLRMPCQDLMQSSHQNRCLGSEHSFNNCPFAQNKWGHTLSIC